MKIKGINKMSIKELERKISQYRKLARLRHKSLLKKIDIIFNLEFKVKKLESKIEELEKELNK